jgi:dienelactone hydrolase
VLDAHAATLFLCRSPSLNCDKLALLGFSNGASTVLMSLADGVAGVGGLESLGPAPLPVALGVAYYPGCGLQSLVSLSEPAAYYPTSPVQILHAELDPLLEHCPTRVMQAAEAAQQRDLAQSPLTLHVYEGEVDHGFDSSPDSAEEEAARSDARARTLDSFANAFASP